MKRGSSLALGPGHNCTVKLNVVSFSLMDTVHCTLVVNRRIGDRDSGVEQLAGIDAAPQCVDFGALWLGCPQKLSKTFYRLLAIRGKQGESVDQLLNRVQHCNKNSSEKNSQKFFQNFCGQPDLSIFASTVTIQWKTENDQRAADYQLQRQVNLARNALFIVDQVAIYAGIKFFKNSLKSYLHYQHN